MKLWSHAQAQSLVHAEGAEALQARELLSHRYGPRALIVLPLSSGAFAIFGPDRQLRQIAENATELEEGLRRTSELCEAEAAARQQMQRSVAEGGKITINISLKEIGL